MAEWETIVLDGEKMLNRREAHDHLTERLALPDYYGRNLDALYDILTEREGPTRIMVRHGDTLLSWLGDYGKALLQTMIDASQANPGLEVLFAED
ncbi:MAG: barstar family protein [Oscillospiraceae bacterium]|nr:barstar family protein [Oscillospiraceae bacterium]